VYAEELLFSTHTEEIEASTDVFTNKLVPRQIAEYFIDNYSIWHARGLVFAKSKLTFGFVADQNPNTTWIRDWAVKCDEKKLAKT
jgi:hypothetical protein